MTSETLKFENGRFLLKEVGDPKLRAKLRQDPYWKSMGNDDYSTDSLGAVRRFRSGADEKVEKIFKRAFQTHYQLPELALLPNVDPHQWEGIKWILTRKRSYLAHAPGAGKTAQAILAAIFAEGPGQNVFIVPPSLVTNWEREILKVTGWLGVWPCIGIVRTSLIKESVAWRSDFLLVPDSMLNKDWVYTKISLMKVKLLAVDEASRFKEPSAERSLALYGGKNGDKIYSGIFQNARHAVLLDGSPMPNRPMELWAPTYAFCPEAIDCMGYDDFGYRFCGAKPNERGVWEYKFSSNERELRDRLQKDFMHVVTEDQLTHPERLRSMVFMNEDVRSEEHKTWERKYLSESVNYQIEYLKNGDLARFRKELGLRKVPGIARYIREKLESTNESILVFIWHREVALSLSERFQGIPHCLIIGGMTDTAREILMEEFRNGHRKLLIMNIAVGGRGHNLQKADRVIFGEFSWSDEVNKQCEKRASRKGSEKNFVRCEYLVCPNSMDEIILKSLFTKQERVKRIIG